MCSVKEECRAITDREHPCDSPVCAVFTERKGDEADGCSCHVAHKQTYPRQSSAMSWPLGKYGGNETCELVSAHLVRGVFEKASGWLLIVVEHLRRLEEAICENT